MCNFDVRLMKGLMAGWAVLLLFAVTQARADVNWPQRVAALQQVARTDPACVAIQPFYWEMGDARGRQASGREGRQAPTGQTDLAIASATKWLFGAYVAQVRNGQFSEQDIQALTMRTGYVGYQHRLCVKRRDKKQAALTVAECFAESAALAGRNDAFTPAAVGVYNYNGGHFQFWGVHNGLGTLNNVTLAQRMNQVLGNELQIRFDSPQLAGGARMSGENYGRFLQKLLNGELALGAHLGAHGVCTNRQVCPGQADQSPLPEDWQWHYSLGHWVEDDPAQGDGAFSSAGAFGFYPWIDRARSHYGVIAREESLLQGRVAPDSAKCGQALRKAGI